MQWLNFSSNQNQVLNTNHVKCYELRDKLRPTANLSILNPWSIRALLTLFNIHNLLFFHGRRNILHLFIYFYYQIMNLILFFIVVLQTSIVIRRFLSFVPEAFYGLSACIFEHFNAQFYFDFKKALSILVFSVKKHSMFHIMSSHQSNQCLMTRRKNDVISWLHNFFWHRRRINCRLKVPFLFACVLFTFRFI